MDKELFENAIKPFVAEKHVNPDNNLVKFELVKFKKKSFRVGDIDKEENYKDRTPMGIKPKPIYTPNGKFNSVKEASEFYKVTSSAMFARIKTSSLKMDNRYSWEKKNESNE